MHRAVMAFVQQREVFLNGMFERNRYHGAKLRGRSQKARGARRHPARVIDRALSGTSAMNPASIQNAVGRLVASAM